MPSPDCDRHLGKLRSCANASYAEGSSLLIVLDVEVCPSTSDVHWKDISKGTLEFATHFSPQSAASAGTWRKHYCLAAIILEHSQVALSPKTTSLSIYSWKSSLANGKWPLGGLDLVFLSQQAFEECRRSKFARLDGWLFAIIVPAGSPETTIKYTTVRKVTHMTKYDNKPQWPLCDNPVSSNTIP